MNCKLYKTHIPVTHLQTGVKLYTSSRLYPTPWNRTLSKLSHFKCMIWLYMHEHKNIVLYGIQCRTSHSIVSSYSYYEAFMVLIIHVIISWRDKSVISVIKWLCLWESSHLLKKKWTVHTSPTTANLRKFKDYFSYVSIEYHKCILLSCIQEV